MKRILIISVFACIVHLGHAQNSTSKDSTFILTRTKFLKSLEQKKLSDLMTIVDDSVTMIFPDGDIMKGKNRFLEFNEAWFKKDWKINTEVLSTDIRNDLGYSLVRYRYLRYKPDKTEGSLSYIYLLLIFKKRDQNWFLVHNQHTKILL